MTERIRVSLTPLGKLVTAQESMRAELLDAEMGSLTREQKLARAQAWDLLDAIEIQTTLLGEKMQVFHGESHADRD